MKQTGELRSLLVLVADFFVRFLDHESGLESVTQRKFFSATSSALLAVLLSVPLSLAGSIGLVIPGLGRTLLILFFLAFVIAPFVLTTRRPSGWKSGVVVAFLCSAVIALILFAGLIRLQAGPIIYIPLMVTMSSTVFCFFFSTWIKRTHSAGRMRRPT